MCKLKAAKKVLQLKKRKRNTQIKPRLKQKELLSAMQIKRKTVIVISVHLQN
jgi:hypothetical protein